jgi:hypothetical protein
MTACLNLKTKLVKVTLVGYIDRAYRLNLEKSSTSTHEKLIKLSLLQFLDLSSDICDEIQHRSAHVNRGNHLKVFEDLVANCLSIDDSSSIHSSKSKDNARRNQARNKLASMSEFKFYSLSSDVLNDWNRRFPQEVKEFLDSFHDLENSEAGKNQKENHEGAFTSPSSVQSTDTVDILFGHVRPLDSLLLISCLVQYF